MFQNVHNNTTLLDYLKNIKYQLRQTNIQLYIVEN